MQKQDKPFNFDKRGLLLTMHEFSFSYYGHVYVWVLFVCLTFSFSTNAFQSAVIVVVVVGSSIHEIQLGSFFRRIAFCHRPDIFSRNVRVVLMFKP